MSSFHLPTDFDDVVPEFERITLEHTDTVESVVQSVLDEEDDDDRNHHQSAHTSSQNQLYHQPHTFGDSVWAEGSQSPTTASETGALTAGSVVYGDGGWPLRFCPKTTSEAGGAKSLEGLAGSSTPSQIVAAQSSLRGDTPPFFPSSSHACNLPDFLPFCNEGARLVEEEEVTSPGKDSALSETVNPTTSATNPTASSSRPNTRRRKPQKTPYVFAHNTGTPFSLSQEEIESAAEGEDGGSVRGSLGGDRPAEEMRDYWKLVIKGGRPGAMNSQGAGSKYGPRN
ncbi:hypothetical protein IAR50_003023 [Cryptococcus sp. DSM 104548]